MEDRLQKFAHLIDAGSFTKAARDLHISQPALSMAMHKLERELKTELYIRGSQPLVATTSGKAAYASAKELGMTIRNMQSRLSEISEQAITISIGVIDSVADIMLSNAKIVTALETQAKVSLVINNSRYLLAALQRGDIDVAIIAEQSKPLEANLLSKNIGAEPLVIVVHRDVAGRVRKEYAAQEIDTFISYDQPSHTHAMIDRFFAIQNVRVSPQFYSSSPDVIYCLVMAKKGAAALPFRKVSRQLRYGTLELLDKQQPVIDRSITVVTTHNYQMPHILASTVKSLQDDMQRLLEQSKTEFK